MVFIVHIMKNDVFVSVIIINNTEDGASPT